MDPTTQQLLERLITTSSKNEEKYVEQQAQMVQLLKTLKEREPPAAGPNAEAIRAEKIQKINFNLRKVIFLQGFHKLNHLSLLFHVLFLIL